MARDALAGSPRQVAAAVSGDTLTALQYRAAEAGTSAQLEVSSFHPTEIQLSRTGNRLTFSAAVFGENYKSVSLDLALGEEAHVGLFVCSHEAGVVERAVFSNVRVITPAAHDFKPYSDYLGSHLEVMDVATGLRKGAAQRPGLDPGSQLDARRHAHLQQRRRRDVHV